MRAIALECGATFDEAVPGGGSNVVQQAVKKVRT